MTNVEFNKLVAYKNDITTPSDEQLLDNIAASDPLAFEELYNRYASLLYKYAAARVAHPEDAEEIIQNLFLWLWEKREELIHVYPVKPYLYGAVRHRVADHLAHRAVRHKYRQHILAFERTSDNTTEAIMNVNDLEAIIEQRIATLPANCQTAYRLSRQEQLSIVEVAKRMKLSTGTVENYITQALKQLRTLLTLR
jgi:RNA polymerase sigma-70 factor (family 1)